MEFQNNARAMLSGHGPQALQPLNQHFVNQSSGSQINHHNFNANHALGTKAHSQVMTGQNGQQLGQVMMGANPQIAFISPQMGSISKDVGQIRSLSQDKSKLAFKAQIQLGQKATQLTQDDSILQQSSVISGLGQLGNIGQTLMNQKNQQINFKNMIAQPKKQNVQSPSKIQQQTPIFLPRTGIDQPFMKDRPRFKDACANFEPIANFNTTLCDEYARLDAEKLISSSQNTYDKIVFDCMDYPPPQKRQEGQPEPPPYIDENDCIELPPDESTIDQRKYYPYGAQGGMMGFNNQKPPRLNRYYTKLRSYYLKENEDDDTLIFESRFESGNLRRAVKIGDFEYNLILKYDHNTTAYTQWFYFRIQNARKNQTYKFNIVNLVKPESSYNQGMKPLIYSTKEADREDGQGIGWYRDGQNICYFQNSLKKKGGGFYYTLTFQVQFRHDDDEIYLAHCYPYTYSDCYELLQRLCTPESKDRIRKTIVCKTIAGNDCEMAIITNFASRPEEIAIRRAIIITSRVHPGESNASIIVEGMIQFLVSDDDVAKYLRNNFVFKIIPMLNPDGVIIGNYRCSLSGLDLNRQWIAPSMKQCPENCATKMMMRKTLESRDILFYCDIHGHSRCRNLFMYGCSNQRADRLKERIFPLLFQKNCDFFNFDYCNFQIQKQKESTGRVVMWKEFQLINSFTLETSYLGPTRGIYKDCHFTINCLREMGKMFCITLRDYASNEQKVREAIQELETMFPPPKAEEGLTSQFQQVERNNAFVANQSNQQVQNNGFRLPPQIPQSEEIEDKKGNKSKKMKLPQSKTLQQVSAVVSSKEGDSVKQAKVKSGSKGLIEPPSTSSKQQRNSNQEAEQKKSKKISQPTAPQQKKTKN